MSYLKAVCLSLCIVIGAGCAVDSGPEGSEPSAVCSESIHALLASPAPDHLSVTTTDLEEMGCARDESDGLSAAAIQCEGDDELRICMCGNGGSCYREGNTYWCGCN
jgi:hypothetical protein